MTWFEVVVPLMVIGLLGMIFYFITSSAGMSRRKGRAGRIEAAHSHQLSETSPRLRDSGDAERVTFSPTGRRRIRRMQVDIVPQNAPPRHSFYPKGNGWRPSTSLTLSLCLADSAKWQTHTTAPSLSEAAMRDTGHGPETSGGANG